MVEAADRGRSEFSRGWSIVFASAVGMMLGVTGLPFYTLGVFAKPIIHEFGWTRGQYQGAFLATLLGAMTAPVFGYFCDRFGVRRVALYSTAGFAVGFAGIGVITTHSIGSFYFAWVLMALLAQGTGPLAWTRIIGQWFVKHRGLALGVALMGSGMTAVVAPPLATALIAALGWRAAYVVLGAAVLLISWPILWIFLKPPATVFVDVSAAAGIAIPREHGMEFASALQTYRFWVIAAAFFTAGFGVAGIIANIIPLLVDRGEAAASAARFASMIGVSVITGRLLVGYLLDRLWAPGVTCVLLILPATASLGLAAAPPESGTALCLLIVGFAAGAEFDLLAFLVSRYFGLRNYGRIYGLQYTLFFVGSALAPFTFGTFFDIYKSYTVILGIVAAAFVFAAAIVLTLGRYPAKY